MKNNLRVLFGSAILVSVLAAPALSSAQSPFHLRLESDAAAIVRARGEMRRVMAFVESRSDIFPAEKMKSPRLLDRSQRMSAWAAWSRLLDALAVLDAVAAEHRDFWRLEDGGEKAESFRLLQASFLAGYRHALEFIHRVDRDPGFDTLLNESVPELGLQERSLAAFKFRFLHLGRGTEFAALQALALGFDKSAPPTLQEIVQEDAAFIWQMGQGRGEALTLQNALQVIQDAGRAAWFPVQKGVSSWMGDTRVRRKGEALISPDQIRALQPRLKPGDILLQRREWYLSNLGLPGFWTHVALYIGTPEERRAIFDGDDVREWVRSQGEEGGDFEDLLRSRYPAAYGRSLQVAPQGHPPRVLEAIAEGVSFTTLEHSAAADSLAVLRPRLSLPAKASAVLRAFHYSGRPYDFEFDFRTDSALVCSELVFKAYEGGGTLPRYEFPVVEILGRPLTPPNDIVRQFDARWGTPDVQGDLIVFLDGHEREGRAVEATREAFRESWRRPKWHVLLQDGHRRD